MRAQAHETSDDRATGLPAVTLANLRDGSPTLPLWHRSKPSAAAVLGVGRTLAYQMAAEGTIPTVRVGRRIVVPVPRLLAMLGEGADQ